MKTEFVNVARLSDLKQGRGIVIPFRDVGVEVALFRLGDTCVAINNICPHEHTPGLADGPVKHGYVTCPMHGWMFNLATGTVINGAKGVATYRVRVEGNTVSVEQPEEVRPSWSV